MKKLLIFFIAAIMACNSQPDRDKGNDGASGHAISDSLNPLKAQEHVDSLNLAKAQELASKIFDKMDDYADGKISVEKFNRVCRGWQKSLDSIRPLLPAPAQQKLDEYRERRLRDVLDNRQ
jgi:hypothetical protein